MESPDLERWDRIRASLAQWNLAAIVCRLPETVVMLSGYWPVLGRSVVVFPAEGEPVLLAPGCEAQAIEHGWIGDVRTFSAWQIGDDDPEAGIVRLLGQVFSERGLHGRRIGFEGSFGDVSALQRILEPWAGIHSTLKSYVAVCGAEEWVDFSPRLVELSGRKTEREVARVRLANEIADLGLATFFREAVPGRRETEIAAAVETAIYVGGIGYKGIGNARAEAEVISGHRTASAWDFPTTSDRRVEAGDLVIIELAVVADGYWADLTRTTVAGEPDSQQYRLLAAQRAAYCAGLESMKPGVAARQADAAARRALDEFGMASLFLHHTGHGVGFRYHEPIPFVHPESADVLAVGMISSLEPGLYGATFGVRVEDNVVITPNGAEALCLSPRWPMLAD